MTDDVQGETIRQGMEHCQAAKAKAVKMLEWLEAGSDRLYRGDGKGPMVDVTDEYKNDQRTLIERMNRLIEAYERILSKR